MGVLTTLGMAPLATVLWLVGDRRSLHLFKWNPFYLYVFIGIAVFSVLIALTTAISAARSWKRNKRNPLGPVGMSALLLGLVFTIGFYLYLTPYAAASDKPPQLIVTDQPGADGVPVPAIIRYTRKPSKDTILYGSAPDRLNSSFTEKTRTKTHSLLFYNAVPGEKIYWKLDNSSEIHSFGWFTEGIDSLRIAVSSDSHIGADNNNEEAFIQILTQITSSDPAYDLFFHLGDAVEMGNSDEQYTRYISLSAPFSTVIPTVQLMGNHDGWFGGMHYWKQFFYPDTLPKTSGSQLYHRYDLGDSVHILTPNLEWGTETYTETQRTWLEGQLAEINPDDLIIIMNHSFYFASSTEYDGIPWYDHQEMIEKFHDLYVSSGVDMVFSGHDHQMEHIAQDGIDYVIIGAMGGPPDKPPTHISPGSGFLSFDYFGYADLQIKPESVTVTFRQTNGSPVYSWKRTR